MAGRRAHIACVILGVSILLATGFLAAATVAMPRPALAEEGPCGGSRCGGVEGGADQCGDRTCGEVPGGPGPCGDVTCGTVPGDEAPTGTALPAGPATTPPPPAPPGATDSPGGQSEGGSSPATTATALPGAGGAAPELDEAGARRSDRAGRVVPAAAILLGAGAIWFGARRRAGRSTTR